MHDRSQYAVFIQNTEIPSNIMNFKAPSKHLSVEQNQTKGTHITWHATLCPGARSVKEGMLWAHLSQA